MYNNLIKKKKAQAKSKQEKRLMEIKEAAHCMDHDSSKSKKSAKRKLEGLKKEARRRSSGRGRSSYGGAEYKKRGGFSGSSTRSSADLGVRPKKEESQEKAKPSVAPVQRNINVSVDPSSIYNALEFYDSSRPDILPHYSKHRSEEDRVKLYEKRVRERAERGHKSKGKSALKGALVGGLSGALLGGAVGGTEHRDPLGGALVGAALSTPVGALIGAMRASEYNTNTKRYQDTVRRGNYREALADRYAAHHEALDAEKERVMRAMQRNQMLMMEQQRRDALMR